MENDIQLHNVSEIRGAFKAKGAVGAANSQPGRYLDASPAVHHSVHHTSQVSVSSYA